jgi:hypothetical protein
MMSRTAGAWTKSWKCRRAELDQHDLVIGARLGHRARDERVGGFRRRHCLGRRRRGSRHSASVHQDERYAGNQHGRRRDPDDASRFSSHQNCSPRRYR